ncbi:MAG: hypothetical protein QM658_06940, partial [Gordonia sp. (in: high G+C Gram-positive bacteria)]
WEALHEYIFSDFDARGGVDGYVDRPKPTDCVRRREQPKVPPQTRKLNRMATMNETTPLPRKRASSWTLTPSATQVREAMAAGRAYGLNREGEWNPYSGGEFALLPGLWMRAFKKGHEERMASKGFSPTPTRAETAAKFAELGIEFIG